MMAAMSECLVPLVIALVIVVGLVRKVPLYESFLKGAKEGILLGVRLIPVMVALFLAVGVLRNSGFLEEIAQLVSRPLRVMGGEEALSELVPLLVVRLFSASAANSVLIDLYKTKGPDSVTGYQASVIMCCTETLFYTLAVYFGATGIKKTRWTIPGCLLAMGAGIVTSIWITGIL